MSKRVIVGLACVMVAGGAARADEMQACDNIGQAIPSNGAAQTTLTVDAPAGAAVTGVVVDLDIAHTWLGDLAIRVEHDGVVVTLMERVNIEFFAFGCGGRDIDASFRDDATATPADLCVPTTPNPQPQPMLVGDLRPEQLLAAFNGMEAGGQWTVVIEDQAANDSGTLHSACVTVVFDAPPPACAGDVDGSGGVDVDDLNATLGAWGTDVGVGSPLDLAGGDGVVTVDDLNVVLGNWGAACE